jgi:hypothetical protein
MPLKGPLLMQYLFELGKKHFVAFVATTRRCLNILGSSIVCILHVVFELLQATSCLRPLKIFKETRHNAQIVWLNAKVPDQGTGCPTLLIRLHQ